MQEKFYEEIQNFRDPILKKLDNNSFDSFTAKENFDFRKRHLVKLYDWNYTTAIQRLKAGSPNVPQLICNNMK